MSEDFFAKHDLNIQIIDSVCGPCYVGNIKGFFFALLKQYVPHVQSIHCFLHQHALTSKTLLLKLKNVLNISVKAISLIRGHDLIHRHFKSLCQDYGCKYFVFLFHTEVCWLSRGRALTRFFELRKEVKASHKEHDYDHVKEIDSKDFFSSTNLFE